MGKIGHEMKVKLKIYLGVLFFCLILGTGVYYSVTISNAATITVGTVSASTLNVRSGPGTTNSVLGVLGKGEQVKILGEENGWYKIEYNPHVGYVSKSYITDVRSVEEEPEAPIDEAYINELVAKGFPKSYAVELERLHSKYPNWVFEPVVTGLEWSTVIAEESELGTNLVQSINNDAQKSTASGAYNWYTNTWYGYDTNSWVCASPEMIAYCMDPRNFLNVANIFQFATNEYQSYQGASGVQALLGSSFMKGNYTEPNGEVKNYADTFVSVGSQVGVNPYHLAARCLQEQGINGGKTSSGTVSGYENYFNYFNIGAYPANGLTAIQNGLKYAKNKGWNTRYASILGGSEIVGKNYIKMGQNTGYFQKFNVVNETSGLFTHQYMTNVQAAISEGKNMKKAYDADMNAAILFRIPIYNNMPETICPLPTSGNPNNWIKSLAVDRYTLTPGFDAGITEYSLIVEETVESVTISGTPIVSTSKITGTGKVHLNYGSNQIAINCTAQNGTMRTYIVNIVRQGEAPPPELGPEPNPNPDEEPNQGKKGDVNSDGRISNADIVLMERHMLALSILPENQVKLADVNSDGKVSNADIVLVERHILGLELIP